MLVCENLAITGSVVFLSPLLGLRCSGFPSLRCVALDSVCIASVSRNAVCLGVSCRDSVLVSLCCCTFPVHSCSVDFAICALGVCGERARARVCVCARARTRAYFVSVCVIGCLCSRARFIVCVCVCVCVFACVSVCAIAHYECLFSSRTWAKKRAPGQKRVTRAFVIFGKCQFVKTVILNKILIVECLRMGGCFIPDFTHTHAHARTHARARAHTHTYTHTHARARRHTLIPISDGAGRLTGERGVFPRVT